MNDLISRKAVLDMLKKIDNAVYDGEGYQYKEWVDYVEELPTYSAEQTAEWITKNKITYSGSFWEIKCSNCGKEAESIYNYCPNCGAKIKGETE